MPVIVMMILLFTACPALAVGPYTDNGDGTVTDNGTGLMWQQTDDGNTYRWLGALSYCENLELPSGGYSDWRLPNIEELLSIVKDYRYEPAIDSVFSCRSSNYWSATIVTNFIDSAWVVRFYDGTDAWCFKTNTFYVRCVRGGLFVPEVPSLAVSTNGLTVTLSWNSVADADKYTLYYAPYPYAGPDTIGSLDMGNNTSFSVDLWNGASFYVTITASNDAGESSYSNVELFTLCCISP